MKLEFIISLVIFAMKVASRDTNVGLGLNCTVCETVLGTIAACGVSRGPDTAGLSAIAAMKKCSCKLEDWSDIVNRCYECIKATDEPMADGFAQMFDYCPGRDLTRAANRKCAKSEASKEANRNFHVSIFCIAFALTGMIFLS